MPRNTRQAAQAALGLGVVKICLLPSLLQWRTGAAEVCPGGGCCLSPQAYKTLGCCYLHLSGKSRGAGKQRAGSLCTRGQGQGDADAALPRMLWKPRNGLSGCSVGSVETLCGSEEPPRSADSGTLTVIAPALRDPRVTPRSCRLAVRSAVGRLCGHLDVSDRQSKAARAKAMKENSGGVTQALCTLTRFCLPHSRALSAA